MKKHLLRKAILLFFCLAHFILHLTPANAAELHGFVEGSFGAKFGDERADKDEYNLLEGRIQLKSSYFPERPLLLSDWGTEFFMKGDILLDGYEEKADIEIREAYA